jgi:lipoprotein signal peptidase
LIAAAFFIIGLLISWFTYKNKRFSLAKIVVCIIVLCLVDQGIKLYIVNNLDISMVIIKDWLAIKVTQNTYGSFIFSLFDKKMPDIFVLIGLLAIYVLYRCMFFYQRNSNLSFLFLSLIIMCAAFICVCLDKVIYGGTYDYIFLYQKLYFDLKDCYATSSIFTILLSCIYDKSWSEIKKDIRFDPLGIKYFKYEIKSWRDLIAKLKHKRVGGSGI